MDNNEKDKLIQEFMELAKGKGSDEILPLILAISNKAQRLGINLTTEDALQIINNLETTPEKKRQLNKIIQLLTQF